MKRILCIIFILVVLCCCVSCTNNELSYGFSLNNFKTNTGMYLAVKASANQKTINLSIYYGNNFYNDDDFLSYPNCEENGYVVSIRFIYDGNEKTIFFKNLDDFFHLDFDCVFKGKLIYKKMFVYSIQKEELEQNGIIEIALTSLSTTDDSYSRVYQRIKYIKGGKILIES